MRLPCCWHYGPMHIGMAPCASQSVSELPRPVTRLMGCFSPCIGEIDHAGSIYQSWTCCSECIIRTSRIHTLLYLSISVAAQCVFISTENCNWKNFNKVLNFAWACASGCMPTVPPQTSSVSGLAEFFTDPWPGQIWYIVGQKTFANKRDSNRRNCIPNSSSG